MGILEESQKKVAASHGVVKSSVRMARIACIIFAPMTFICGFSTIKILGVFFLPFQRTYGASATLVSFTLSLPISSVFFGGPLYGSIFNALGAKSSYTVAALLTCFGFTSCYWAPSVFYAQLGLTFFGIGAGIINITTLTIMGRCFHNTRSLAMGACAMGGAICGAIGTPTMQKLIEEYTWRGAIAILGAFTLNVIPCGIIADKADRIIQNHKKCRQVANTFYTNVQRGEDIIATEEFGQEGDLSRQASFIVRISETSSLSDNQENISVPTSKSRRKSVMKRASVVSQQVGKLMDISLLKDSLFLIYCAATGMTICARIMSGLYLVRYAQSENVSDHEAANLISAVEIASFVMCPIASVVTSLRYRKEIQHGKKSIVIKPLPRAYVLVIFQLSMSFVMLYPTISTLDDRLKIYAIFLGMCYGGIGPLPNIVIIDLFGTERLAGAMGYRSLASGLSIISIPVLIGFLIDKTETYRVAQYSISLVIFIAGVLTFFVQLLNARRQR